MFFEDAIIDQFLDRRNATPIQGALGSAVSSMVTPLAAIQIYLEQLGDIFFLPVAKRRHSRTLPSGGVGEFYEEATLGRSASHHLQIKATLALLYDVLGSTNPFAGCASPILA